MVIGNQSGKSKDIREEQQRWEQQKREMAHREELRRREQQRMEEQRRREFQRMNTNRSIYNGSSSSDELTQARHRAEQREAELLRELEIRRIQEERRRALLEFQERERKAQEQLQRIKNGQSINSNNRDLSHNPVY